MGAHDVFSSTDWDAGSISFAALSASHSPRVDGVAIDLPRPPTHSRRIAIGRRESNP
jgi:hypothetical protein